MNKAVFNTTSNGIELLCSECGICIRTQDQFDVNTQYAAKGIITLLPQYCDAHKYLGMDGNDRKREIVRRGIREKLREGIMNKNILNVDITRPNQELVIMRGIPSSGKSTKAKTLVGEGIIHSTDDLIEATGDYNGHFARMVESKDWSAHSKMHFKNFLNAKASMETGITPVVIDNTNIKANEAKKYVESALRMGLDENNISIVDVADGGCTAELLAERNTHNVPLKTINRMMSSHKGVGTLTVKRILESKSSFRSDPEKVLYSAVILNKESQAKLLDLFVSKLPFSWEGLGHHMTIAFGKGVEDKSDLGKEVELTVTALGMSDTAMAVRVEGYPTTNKIPHITVAVNTANGGTPAMSKDISDWGLLDLGYTLKLYGTVTDVRP
jgi:predicted kinase